MDNILLEIRTHLEGAKEEINILQHQFEQRLYKQSIKLGLNKRDQNSPFRTSPGGTRYHNDDEIALERQLQAKVEVIEEDVAVKHKETSTALAHLQRENVGMQRRITESVSQQAFDMQFGLFRSQFEEYQRQHIKELQGMRNTLHTARFEIETEIMSRLDEKLQHAQNDQHDKNSIKSELYDYLQSKLKQMSKAYQTKFTQLFKQSEATEERIR